MAGTPTGDQAQDTPAGQRGDGNGLAWVRPVPERWSPTDTATATGGGPLEAAVSRPPRAEAAGPVNATVMGTAPGEDPA